MRSARLVKPSRPRSDSRGSSGIAKRRHAQDQRLAGRQRRQRLRRIDDLLNDIEGEGVFLAGHVEAHQHLPVVAASLSVSLSFRHRGPGKSDCQRAPRPRSRLLHEGGADQPFDVEDLGDGVPAVGGEGAFQPLGDWLSCSDSVLLSG